MTPKHPGTWTPPLHMRLRACWSRLRQWLLSDGEGGPPNNWASSRPCRATSGSMLDYHARFLNDAFEIGIAVEDDSSSRWAIMLDANVFRRLALWYLWRWAVGEWFGVRRRVFYWDLHRHVEAMVQQVPVMAEKVKL